MLSVTTRAGAPCPALRLLRAPPPASGDSAGCGMGPAQPQAQAPVTHVLGHESRGIQHEKWAVAEAHEMSVGVNAPRQPSWRQLVTRPVALIRALGMRCPLDVQVSVRVCENGRHDPVMPSVESLRDR